MIANRRERGADFGDLLQLARPLAELPLELIGALLLIEELERALDRAEERGIGRVFREAEVNAFIREPSRLLGEADADDGGACVERERLAVAVDDREIDEHDAQSRRVAQQQLIERRQTSRRDRLARQRVGVAG